MAISPALNIPYPVAMLALVALSALAGCSTDKAASRPGMPGPGGSTVRHPTTNPPSPADRPVALLGESLVARAELWPVLAEAAGAAALEEVAIDRELRVRLREGGVAITPEAVERERQLLARALADSAELSPDQVEGVLVRLRRARGLGPARYRALLERNAGLRALVASAVAVPTEEIEQEVALRCGPRVVARVILAPTAARAAELRAQALDAGGNEWAFAEIAMRHSNDSSAPAGGLTPEFSLSDPGVPAVIRSALATLEPGAMSPVLATDDAFAIVLLRSRVPGRSPTDQDRARATEQVRARKERLAMERLARDLVRSARITAMDESLRWSWSSREAP